MTGRLLLPLVAVTAAASLLALGRLHREQTADSLVPVLVSLHQWTPFYWEQNRYGMLTPLLARPVPHPVANLVVQTGVTAWAAFAAFWLAGRYLVGPRLGTAAGLLAAAAWVLVVPAKTQWLLASTVNVFGLGLALGLAGLVALEPGRRWFARYPVAVAAVLVAAWVNAATGVMLGPVAALVPWTRPGPGRWRRAAGGVALCGLAAVAGVLLGRTEPVANRTTHVRLPPAAAWPGLIEKAATEMAAETHPAEWVAFALLLTGGGVAHVARHKPGAAAAAAMLLATVAAAAAYSGLMLVLFDGRWRYAVPGLVLVHVALVAAAVGPRVAGRGDRDLWRLEVGAAAGLVAAVVLVWGGPSVTQVEADLAAVPGAALADRLHTAGATHFAGDYWQVWPAVFASDVAAADAGRPAVWGVSHRSGPTAPQWQAPPRARVRVACLPGDPAAAVNRAKFPYPLTRTADAAGFEVWVAE